jgi:hypothetical protein
VGEATITNWGSRLLPNMSVKWVIVEEEQLKRGVESLALISEVETDGCEARLADHPVVVNVPGSLPRFFIQDRVVLCSEAEAWDELINGDLRGAVFVEDGDRLSVIGNQWTGDGGITDHRLPITDYRFFAPASQEETVERFEDLQAANRILDLETSNPNRVRVTVEITRPAMLVMTDVWHPDWSATVDGDPVELLRVNFLQRGIWLDTGRQEVIMTFIPRSWKIGRWGTLVGLIALMGLMIRGGRKRRDASSSPPADRSQGEE